ncbi:MAG: peptide-methionine (S)-S-oxide reductase [Polyangiales bacterium]
MFQTSQDSAAEIHTRSGSEIAEAVRDGELHELTLGMGCFWGPDSRFGAMDGVVQTRVGYSGGTVDSPLYRNMPGHAEVTRVTFDPALIEFEELFEGFRNWLTPKKAFGSKYRPLIFAPSAEHNDAIHEWARSITDPNARPQVAECGDTETRFWDAEAYHQKWRLKKSNPDLAESLLERFGPAWDETELATKLNGFEKDALSNARAPLIRSLLGTPKERLLRRNNAAGDNLYKGNEKP